MIRVKKIGAIWLLFMLLLETFSMPYARAITVQEELDLGQEFMEQVNQYYKLSKDPYLERYINELGQRLLQQFSPQPFEFHFYIVEQEVYNAFAGPAGNVFINSGLLAAMDSEAELAGILGHEISHVTCRHISENIERAGKIQVGTLAGVLAGILLGAAAGSSTASEALIVSSMAAGQSVYLTYSREAEKEADEIGVKALMAAGYPVQGLVTMLKKIKEKDWYGDDIPSYLGTHPGVDERIVYLSRFIDYNREQGESSDRAPETDFNLAHTRVMALFGDRGKATAWFESLAEKEPENYIPDYGLGLLAMRERRLEEAKTYFRKALEKRAFDSHVLGDLGKCYFNDGEYEAARKILESAMKMDPKNLESRSYLGQTLLALKDPSGARGVFERLYADKPEHYEALYYLGEAYDKEGKRAEAYYYLGLYFLNTGDAKRAVFNLKRARSEAADEGLREKIDLSLKEAEEEEKEQKKKETEEREKSEEGQQWGITDDRREAADNRRGNDLSSAWSFYMGRE